MSLLGFDATGRLAIGQLPRQSAIVPPPPITNVLEDLFHIYIRDEWRTVIRVFNYTVLLGILLGM